LINVNTSPDVPGSSAATVTSLGVVALPPLDCVVVVVLPPLASICAVVVALPPLTSGTSVVVVALPPLTGVSVAPVAFATAFATDALLMAANEMMSTAKSTTAPAIINLFFFKKSAVSFEGAVVSTFVTFEDAAAFFLVEGAVVSAFSDFFAILKLLLFIN
jgi:hypothetical protein